MFTTVSGVQEALSDLPSARAISLALFQTEELAVSATQTRLHMNLGQLLDHDTDQTAISKHKNQQTGKF